MKTKTNLKWLYNALLVPMAIVISHSIVLGQTAVNDTTFIYGKLLNDESTGKPLTQGCNSTGAIRFFKGETISIIGFEICHPYGNMNATPGKFYHVLKDTGAVFIPVTSIKVLGEWAEKITSLTPEDFAVIENNVQKKYREYVRLQEQEAQEKKRIADSLEIVRVNKLNAFIDKAALKGICIYESKPFDVSEYTDGTGMEMTFYNPTKKEIKYIHATVVGYNAVKDPVIELGKTSHTLKCIGPMPPNDHGTYKFDYVWHSDLVETAKVTTIKVQYMDGTEKVIAKPSEVVIPRDLLE
jgi:hypothetical protein